MLFVERVIGLTGGGIDCAVSIPPNCPFAAGSTAPCFVGLEMAAQAAATLEALVRAGAGLDAAPRIGYLVGIRSARFHDPELPVGRRLVASIRPAGSAPPLSVYEAEIRRGGRICLEAVISTYITEEQGRRPEGAPDHSP
jgi:predicted hotdog family 3-hydroxylacyl-ACP dehydratase